VTIPRQQLRPAPCLAPAGEPDARQIYACPVCGFEGQARWDPRGAVVDHPRRFVPCRIDPRRHAQQYRELLGWWPLLPGVSYGYQPRSKE
jgi:hypothetical protein